MQLPRDVTDQIDDYFSQREEPQPTSKEVRHATNYVDPRPMKDPWDQMPSDCELRQTCIMASPNCKC